MKTFREAISASGFVVSGQLRLHQDLGRDEVLRQARCLSEAVDAVSVTDCPYGVVHMSGLAVAALLLQHQIDPLLQLACRDRNRIALKSELLGAAALGVTSLILQRGDKLPKDAKAGVKQVFDTRAKRLLATARQLSEFQVAHGGESLFLGTLATVFDPDEDWEPAELKAKAEAGAEFVQTQVCLDVDRLRRYMRFLVASQTTWQCKVVVSVPVLTTVDSVRWLAENLRGSAVPRAVLKRFESAKDPEAFGIEFCAETIQAIREIPGVSGVNLSTTGEPETIVAAVRQAAV